MKAACDRRVLPDVEPAVGVEQRSVGVRGCQQGYVVVHECKACVAGESDAEVDNSQ